MKVRILEAIKGEVGKAVCPACGQALAGVRYPEGRTPLSREQWESQRAGDWWCSLCPDNGRGKNGAYYWQSEIFRTVEIGPTVHEDERFEIRDEALFFDGLLLERWTYQVLEPSPLLELAVAGGSPQMAPEMGDFFQGLGELGGRMLETFRKAHRILDAIEEVDLEVMEGKAPTTTRLLRLDPDARLDRGDVSIALHEIDRYLRMP